MSHRAPPRRPLAVLGACLPLALSWACGPRAGAPRGGAGDGLRDAPPSTLRSVTNPVLTLRLLDLGPRAEGGGGDALLVADSSGPHPWYALIDAGDSNRAAAALEAAGIDTLDLLVVTHAHFDHYGGVGDVLGVVAVRRVLHNGQVRGSVTWRRFLARVAAEVSDLEVVRTPLDVGPAGGPLRVRVLPPLTTFLALDTDDGQEINDGSLAVRFDLGTFSLLTTGDAERLANDRFRSTYPGVVDVDVLKVGHHGSSDAMQPLWLAAVGPEVALVSANGTTHPHSRALDMIVGRVGPEIFCTPEHGDITLRVAVTGRYSVRTRSDARKRCEVGSAAR